MEPLYLDYASGALSPATRLLVETHLSMRPERRADVAVWDTVGAALLEADARPMRAGARERAEQKLERDEDGLPAASHDLPDLPQPLASAIGRPLESLRWTSPIPGMHEWAFPDLPEARLLRLRPGGGVFEHSHTGQEVTLILRGAYADEEGLWRPGDVEVADRELWHAPKVVGDEECLCLAVTEGRYRLKGLYRLLAEFTGFRGRLA